MDEFETTNIHVEWLKNIYKQLMIIQDMERISREGCRDLMEYLQIPIEYHGLVIPDAQYKNLRFFVIELDILINNLKPTLREKSKDYTIIIKQIMDNIDRRDLFIKERRINNNVVSYYLLPFFYKTIQLLVKVKSDIISDIGHLLYLPEEEKGKKKW